MRGLFVDVLKTHIEDFKHVVVGEGVIDVFTVASSAYEVALSQNLELVRDGSSAHVEKLGEVCHAELSLVKSPKHAEARAVSENLEEVREVADVFVGRELFSHFRGELTGHIQTVA